MTIPEDNLYTREHEWLRIEGNKAEVGITEHAQKSLGDIVYVELPEIGDEIDAGDEFGSIESVKAVNSLYMPMSGNIIAVNTELKDSPETINEECYDEGWLIRFELSNQEESSELLSSKDYKEFLQEEED
ncbi:MAG: glycine cleavage system protein GcvH [bacterium]